MFWRGKNTINFTIIDILKAFYIGLTEFLD